eukprot:jgi/Chrzof1/13475/UNPLg00561.t1
MADPFAIVAFVLSVVTFIVNIVIKSWFAYMKVEWDKQVLAADLDFEYGEIQQYATCLAIKRETFRRVRDGSERERIAGRVIDYRAFDGPLDYADGFLVRQGDDDTKNIREMDVARQQLARFWDKVYGYYEAHKLLRGTKCTWLRKRFGLPTGDFFSRKWAGRGERHCQLVEPLDVANWYKIGETRDYCDMMHEARPPRYVLLQHKAEEVFRKAISSGLRGPVEVETQLRSRNTKYRRALRLEVVGQSNGAAADIA